MRILRWVVAAIALNSVVVSFLIGWHWVSDLLGGLVAGGLFLRLIVDWDGRARRWAGTVDSGVTAPGAQRL